MKRGVIVKTMLLCFLTCLTFTVSVRSCNSYCSEILCLIIVYGRSICKTLKQNPRKLIHPVAIVTIHVGVKCVNAGNLHVCSYDSFPRFDEYLIWSSAILCLHNL